MADSDIVLVHKVSRNIEEVLCDRFGAEGRGLHEKLSSVNHLIPNQLEKKSGGSPHFVIRYHTKTLT